MTQPMQRPLGSPFQAKSTAQEVLADIDLTGRHVIVTGGYSGIGLETVRAMLDAGASVTVPARRMDVAKQALAPISERIDVAALDLADLSSVKSFAASYVASGRALDLLINNAGIMACPETRTGAGWEAQFAVNHLGHMALFLGLVDALKQSNGARVVALSSTGHALSDIHWDDPHFRSHAYDKWQAYGQAKTANALFALELDRRYADAGIRGYSVHPGGIFTPLQRHLPEEEMVALGWKAADGSIPNNIKALFKTPEQGASTTCWAATSPLLHEVGGVYCEDADVAPLADANSRRGQHVRPWACDPDRAERLWQMSLQMLNEA